MRVFKLFWVMILYAGNKMKTQNRTKITSMMKDIFYHMYSLNNHNFETELKT